MKRDWCFGQFLKDSEETKAKQWRNYMVEDLKYIIAMLESMHKDSELDDRTPINLLYELLEKLKNTDL